jgi:hypothetical protein
MTSPPSTQLLCCVDLNENYIKLWALYPTRLYPTTSKKFNWRVQLLVTKIAVCANATQTVAGSYVIGGYKMQVHYGRVGIP